MPPPPRRAVSGSGCLGPTPAFESRAGDGGLLKAASRATLYRLRASSISKRAKNSAWGLGRKAGSPITTATLANFGEIGLPTSVCGRISTIPSAKMAAAFWASNSTKRVEKRRVGSSARRFVWSSRRLRRSGWNAWPVDGFARSMLGRCNGTPPSWRTVRMKDQSDWCWSGMIDSPIHSCAERREHSTHVGSAFR